MKKLSYLLGLFLVTGMLFSSCSKDEETVDPPDLTPVITSTVILPDGTAATSIEIKQGESILLSSICIANTTSGKKLETYKVYTIVDNVVQDPIFTVSDIGEVNFTSTDSITFLSVFEGKLFAEITDKDNETSNVSFNINVAENTTPLGAEEDLMWKREYGADATGLDMFGLKWTSNAKEVHAQIEKADGGAEKFVQLTAEEWASIETVEDLAIAVETGDDLDVYEGISVEVAHDDYDEVLATRYNGEYFIIHLESSTIEVDPTLGSIITIFGKSKK